MARSVPLNSPFDHSHCVCSFTQCGATYPGSGLLVSSVGLEAGDNRPLFALITAGVAEDFPTSRQAGGCFLEWMEGNRLPGVDVLKT